MVWYMVWYMVWCDMVWHGMVSHLYLGLCLGKRKVGLGRVLTYCPLCVVGVARPRSFRPTTTAAGQQRLHVVEATNAGSTTDSSALDFLGSLIVFDLTFVTFETWHRKFKTLQNVTGNFEIKGTRATGLPRLLCLARVLA